MAHDQQQFLNVISRDDAEKKFRDAVAATPLRGESVPLETALHRILCDDVIAPCDVPSFDRSNFDGFAVRADDTTGAEEESPCRLQLLRPAIATGKLPQVEIAAGQAVSIATGGMLPRGADAVVMIEHAEAEGETLLVRKASSPGFGVSFAGTDIARGETVLFAGTRLTSRETGILAAIGVDQVTVHRRPKVAILSTGDEIISPGQPAPPPLIYDSNSRVLADAVRELGGEPLMLGIVADDADLLRSKLAEGLAQADAVLLSGGTSKGAGDISYRVVGELKDPGVIAHGVALKPGKPICLAAERGKPVVILPGFPTSAIFTFHEFVAPVLRTMAGLADDQSNQLSVRLATKVNSVIGRTEYMLVNLVADVAETEFEGEPSNSPVPSVPPSLHRDAVAYPIGKGSGSVTTFAQADGFLTIDRHTEIVAASSRVNVTPLARDLRPADLVVIGSHCIGLDFLLSQLNREGIRSKAIYVGSTAGLHAAAQGHCDIAGIHLLDETSGEYNRPFLSEGVQLVEGYQRRQGIVYRNGDARFANLSPEQAMTNMACDPNCRMVNRNAGSGTRILLDRLLGENPHPPGYSVQAKSHTAVAAAIAQRRADWGVCIEHVARGSGLGFLPLADERYDFAVPATRRARPAVQRFITLLQQPEIQEQLSSHGLKVEK